MKTKLTKSSGNVFIDLGFDPGSHRAPNASEFDERPGLSILARTEHCDDL